ncbi:MAG: hypothetical protein Q9M11_00085 [Mariprofundaceae bacterium]|nr:hypothetical protein [Mariprofundaceae bacterium]MDQ6990118.1 hypothetical protein [Mariprofundaceae bacterium]
MQINPTGQITAESQVQAIVSGAQTPVQTTADTQVAASAKDATQLAVSDPVTISPQAQTLAKSDINESSSSESIEPMVTQASEGESSRSQGA